VAENTSSETVTARPEATLEDSEGNTYETDDTIEPPADDPDGAEIPPGEMVASAAMYFEVPGDASPGPLELSDDGEERARIDLTREERGEIPPSDYLQIYTLRFNERAYKEIYGLYDENSTGGVSLGYWLSYFERLWSEWYLGLDSISSVSEDGERAVLPATSLSRPL
jgi:hypothetical protein